MAFTATHSGIDYTATYTIDGINMYNNSGSYNGTYSFKVDNDGIYKSDGSDADSILVNTAGIRFGHVDGYTNIWDTTLTLGGKGLYKEMTTKCFGPAAIVANHGIDGGFGGYYDDGNISTNNNTPANLFYVDYSGFHLENRVDSGSSAKMNDVAYYDQFCAITGIGDDPASSSTVLTDYGFGFFGEYPSSDSFVGLTPTGVKLHGGSSSKILVSDGTMSTLKTVNGESLLGDGDVAHVFYFDEYNVLTTPTISSAIPATATNVSVGGMYFFAKINKFLALVTYNYSSTGYRQYFNIKDGCVVDSLGTAIASVPALDSKYPRNSYGKAPDIYICTGTSIAYFGTGSGSTATTLTKLYGSLASKDSLSFSELTSKPTTLSGYGITDAVSTSGGTING